MFHIFTFIKTIIIIRRRRRRRRRRILFFLVGQGLFKSLHKLLVSVRVCGLAGVDPGPIFLLGVVNFPWLQLHLGCDQGMVSVAVSAVEGSGAADAVDGIASREDHVQLMPML